MKELIHAQKMIYPDLLEVMQKRYSLLYTIFLFQPIGRRGLIEQTKLQERFIRNETELLKKQGLIEMTTKGMLITHTGEAILKDLYMFNRELLGVATLEHELQSYIGDTKVIVVPGDSDQSEFVKHEIGRATVDYLQKIIQDDVTIAVTGGTTMAAVANAMVPFEGYECSFVPARGGVGEKVENQANSIVAKMAKAEQGNYHLLHVPDPLSETLYQTIIHEPQIKETLNIIKNTDIVIHGIGEALAMASRRKTSQRVMDKLIKDKAVSEAFGYYFDITGQIVHKVRTVGIQLEDLTHINQVITVAGGKSKAQAILSYMIHGKSDVLVTDEAAALEIINLYKN
ncbi:MAG TPA: sugar-binding domain-containing protein [Pseudogracilibacillus sp.]|nr:sugar-binding domain-containing protein [Pseudogracilibacillus sp.]